MEIRDECHRLKIDFSLIVYDVVEKKILFEHSFYIRRKQAAKERIRRKWDQ